EKQLNLAQIILLLISADFMASDFCWSVELERAMERHEAREARVIPIILREVDWQSAIFSKLVALPTNAKPVTRWANQDQAFTDITKGIRRVVEELLASQT
ncbi:MAG: TIR domain-containing protein, partial [Nostoc sp.]